MKYSAGKRGIPNNGLHWATQLKKDIVKTGFIGSWKDAIAIKNDLRTLVIENKKYGKKKKVKHAKKIITQKGFLHHLNPNENKIQLLENKIADLKLQYQQIKRPTKAQYNKYYDDLYDLQEHLNKLGVY